MLTRYDLGLKQAYLRKKEKEFQACYDRLMLIATDSHQWDATIIQYKQLYAETTLLANEIGRAQHPTPHKFPGANPESIYHIPINH